MNAEINKSSLSRRVFANSTLIRWYIPNHNIELLQRLSPDYCNRKRTLRSLAAFTRLDFLFSPRPVSLGASPQAHPRPLLSVGTPCPLQQAAPHLGNAIRTGTYRPRALNKPNQQKGGGARAASTALGTEESRAASPPGPSAGAVPPVPFSLWLATIGNPCSGVPRNKSQSK